MHTINELGGIWSFFALLLQFSALVAGIQFLRSRRRSLPNVNFTLAVVPGGHEGDLVSAKRRLVVLVRNLSGVDVLIGSAHLFIGDRGVISQYADGDCSAGEYELKFRGNSSVFSEAFTLLRTSQSVETYIPLVEDDDIDANTIIKRLESKIPKSSFLVCKIITLMKTPKVYTCKIHLKNIQLRSYGLYNNNSNSFHSN